MRADTLAPIVWILVLIPALGFAFLVGFVAGRRIPSRQNAGEAMVANAIATGLARPHLLLNNVTLAVADGTAQIDHVLIADTGIFVIETKHYRGWIFGDPGTSHWTQVIYKRKSRFQNPVRQNYGHLKALQTLFTLPANAFVSLVVFTGDVEFKTDLGPAVLKLPKLIEYLELKRQPLFDERQMTYIVGRIEMKRMRRSIETDEHHLNYVRRRIKAPGSRPG